MPKFLELKDLFIEESKIRDYLLNAGHPDGGSKARFLLNLGFNIEESEVLSAAIISLAINNELIGIEESQYGHKLLVDGKLMTPSGRAVFLRTVWFKRKNQDLTKLVTAYPIKNDKGI
ncbi:MAG: DUF6883 domain-containing protein [Bacteroidota bacterium]